MFHRMCCTYLFIFLVMFLHFGSGTTHAQASPTPSLSPYPTVSTSPSPVSSPTSTISLSPIEEKFVHIQNYEQLITLTSQLQIPSEMGGERVLAEVLERQLNSQEQYPVYTFHFVKNVMPNPETGFGIRWRDFFLEKIVHRGGRCQTTLRSGSPQSTQYPLLNSLIGGACSFMASYVSMFEKLKLKTPSGMYVRTSKGDINPELGERVLRDSGYRARPDAGLSKSESKKMYTNYTGDPEFKVECDETDALNETDEALMKEREALEQRGYSYPQIQEYQRRKRKNDCLKLKNNLDMEEDCDFDLSYETPGDFLHHAERIKQAYWDERSGCCVVTTEDSSNPGKQIPFRIGKGTNKTKLCGEQNNTSSLDLDFPLDGATAFCCRKKPR